MDGHADRQTDGWTDRQTDRQIENELEIMVTTFHVLVNAGFRFYVLSISISYINTGINNLIN